MKVYVFGNPDVRGDNIGFNVAKKLKNKIKGLEFVEIKPNEDLPFENKDKVILMDAVEGINEVTVINEKNLEKFVVAKSVSVHDWDLGFQLKYLKKLGKLNKVTIIGLPKEKKVDYLRVQSILRKLVEQEMQGS